MTNLVIKLTSPDGSWQSAKDLIKAIDADAARELGINPTIELSDVWAVKPNQKNTFIQNNGNNSNGNIFYANQGGGENV